MGETTNSNPLGPIKLSSRSETEQGAVNKYDLTVCLLLDCSWAPPPSALKSPTKFPVDSLDLTYEPHPRFPVQGHILNAGGDALNSFINQPCGIFGFPDNPVGIYYFRL